MHGFKNLGVILKAPLGISNQILNLGILPGDKNLTIYDILELWYRKALWDGPQAWIEFKS